MRGPTGAGVAAAAAAAIVLAAPAAIAGARQFSAWGPATNAEVPGASSELNTAFNDGCPIQSPDGLSLYMASNRPGGLRSTRLAPRSPGTGRR
jgi:WD40-like Beta Propeller Repeat